MATMQRINAQVHHISPLINIENPIFEEHYKRELSWYLFEQQELARLLSDEDIVATLQNFAATGLFDEHNDQEANERVAEYVGMLHAAVLLPDGTVKPDVSHFLTFTHPEAQRAYTIARECNFIRPGYAMPKMSDHELLRSITDLVIGEAWERAGSPHTLTLDEWYYSVGDIVGWLSVHLFPWTHEDAHAARERMKDFEARMGYFPDAHDPNTDFYALLHYDTVEVVAA